MANASDQPAPPPLRRPSVFISYASEDRAAARRLRDTLSEAGLEVWYDENELGGGDAWDQKIRRQIRECDYFMALISAATEARKEGYFRREWRLASERTLDMADDVLFLLPVAIDGTSESGARVPDKFLTVQWLRAPGGETTPALAALCRRLAANDHSPPPRNLAPTRPPFKADPGSSPPPTSAPTAIPPFPHVPQTGGFPAGIHFVVEVLKWLFTAGPKHFKRWPKWVRIILIIWFVTTFVFRCSRDNVDTGPRVRTVRTAKKDAVDTTLNQVDAALALKKTAKDLDQTAGAKDTGNLGAGFAKAGADLARAISAEVAPGEKLSHQFTVIPFATGLSDETSAKFATAVFRAFYRQAVAARGDIIGISLDPAESDEAILERGRKLETAYLATARVRKDGDETVLALRLFDIRQGTVIWSSSSPITEDPDDAATELASGLLKAWPKA